MMYLLDVLNILMYTGFGAITLWTYFGLFLQSKGEGILSFIYWTPFLAWQCVWSYLSEQGLQTPAYLNTVISLVMLIIVAIGGYGGSIKRKLVFAMSYLLLTVTSEAVVWYGVQFFCAPDVNVTAWWPPMLTRVVLLLAILLLYFMLRRKNMVEADEKASRYLLILSLGNTFVAYSVFMAYDRLGGYGDKLLAAFTVLILLAITIFVYQIYGKLWENMELKRQNERYSYQIEMYLQQQKEREENEQELRRYRHDLKQKLVYLKGLADVSRSEEISRFLREEFEDTPDNMHPIIHTGNMVVDAMLNEKYQKAARSGIRFEMQIDVPEQLPYRDNDLCVILGNLLDNACEAALHANQGENYINIRILFDRGNLILIVENSFDGKLNKAWDGRLLSRKQDKKNHGIGLKSVRKITEKYNGDVFVENEGTVFRVKVILYG